MFRSCLSCIPMECFFGAKSNDDKITTTAEIGVFRPETVSQNASIYVSEQQLQSKETELPETNLSIINSSHSFILPQRTGDNGVAPIDPDIFESTGSTNSGIIKFYQPLKLPQCFKDDNAIVFSNSPSNIIGNALGCSSEAQTKTSQKKLPIVLEFRVLESGEDTSGKVSINF